MEEKKKKRPMGRQRKFTKKYLNELKIKLDAYIDEEDIPILSEFAYKNKIYRQRLYDFPELTDTIKRCITKKEANLEKYGLSGDINITMAIFSLKQLGWSDRNEVELANKDGKADSKSLVQEWMHANTIAKKDVNTDNII